jgi:hypothetical protein
MREMHKHTRVILVNFKQCVKLTKKLMQQRALASFAGLPVPATPHTITHPLDVWVQHRSPSGAFYYFNDRTQCSTWQRPAAFYTPEELTSIDPVPIDW